MERNAKWWEEERAQREDMRTHYEAEEQACWEEEMTHQEEEYQPFEVLLSTIAQGHPTSKPLPNLATTTSGLPPSAGSEAHHTTEALIKEMVKPLPTLTPDISFKKFWGLERTLEGPCDDDELHQCTRTEAAHLPEDKSVIGHPRSIGAQYAGVPNTTTMTVEVLNTLTCHS